jgi:glycosyltransferase involved in cell wall biosynthesis
MDALAEELALVLFDTGLRRELRARGLARAGAFRWEGTARRLLAVLGEET